MNHSYRYNFNAKEHQPELGLNWHDYHARNYDAALGRWMNVDPLGEKYPSWSPYNYVMNSPLRFTDPTRMFIEPPTKPGEIEGDVHFDEDTGASYEWDGEGGWHSDMQGGEELEEVVIYGTSSSAQSKNYNSKDAIPCVKCHHTATFPEGNGTGFNTILKNRRSGYIQYGGNMRSDFIGSTIGPEGVIYGTVGNIFAPVADIKTKIQFLKYLMDTKTGLGIGHDIADSFMNEQSVNVKIEVFNYYTTDTIWVVGGFREYRMYHKVKKKGYIINKDTLK